MSSITTTGTHKCEAKGRFISWQAYYWEILPDGRKFRRRKSGFQTETAAKAYLRDVRQAAHSGELSHKAKDVPTLAKFLEIYEQQQLADRRPQTRRRTLLTLRQFSEHLGRHGKIRIDSITVQHIEAFKAKRLETCKPATVNRDIEVIRGLFTAAINYDILKENPVSKVKKVKQPDKQVVFLDPEDQKALIEAAGRLPAPSLARTPFLQTMIVLCLNTGLRRGELFHLRWCDIDTKARRLYVCNRADFQTKSGKDRVIGLNANAIKALDDWKGWFDAQREKGKLLMRSKCWRRNDRGRQRLALWERCRPERQRLVFPSLMAVDDYGNPKALENVDSGLEHAVRLAGINRRVGLHVLRHTFAVNLCRAGVSLFNISKLMGHASVQTTEMHYLRFAKDEAVHEVDVLVG